MIRLSYLNASSMNSRRLSAACVQVMAVVNGPHDLSAKAQAAHDRATITVEFRVATFAHSERKKRSKGDKRNMEIEATLKAVFESAILVNAYSRSQARVVVARVPFCCARVTATELGFGWRGCRLTFACK